MSTYLDLLLADRAASPEFAADAPCCPLLSAEQMDAVDDTAAWAEHQAHQLAKFEARMRAGGLRGIPTCFGDLS